MLNAPNIDPVAIQIGWLKVHWYGLMYLAGFAAGWALGVYRAKKSGSGWRSTEVADLLFYIALGVILGGRVGHVLFYDFAAYLAEPLQIFYIWRGGMSFHGGLIGVIAALWLYARHTNRTFFAVADFAVPLGPIGLGLGRLGNLINHELWGRVTDAPWGMVFFRNPDAGPLPRHPTQLYEFFLEGVVLFLILWFYSTRPRPAGAVSGLFLICYGVFRFIVEFVRVPDRQLGYLAFGWVTMGQLLSVPMILAGIGLMVWAYRGRPAAA